MFRFDHVVGRRAHGRSARTLWGVVLVALLSTSLMAGKAATSTDAKESCWPGAPGTDPDLCAPNDPTYP